jgi:hypothetical protein
MNRETLENAAVLVLTVIVVVSILAMTGWLGPAQ